MNEDFSAFKFVDVTVGDSKPMKFIQSIDSGWISYRPFSIINIFIALFELLKWKICVARIMRKREK